MHMHTCIYISPQLVHARLCNGAAASLPWKLLSSQLRKSEVNYREEEVGVPPPSNVLSLKGFVH